MDSMGSPFDAPLPRFQQAAANLAGNAKKPPLSPAQQPGEQASLKASASLKAPSSVATEEEAAQQPSQDLLARSTSHGHLPRRRTTSLVANMQRGDFQLSASLASVKEGDDTQPLMTPTTSLGQALDSKEQLFKSVSLPVLPKSGSLSLALPCPCPALLQPACPQGRGCWARLPSLLAMTAMLGLLLMTACVLRPPAAVPEAQAGASALLPRKFLNGWLRQEDYVAVSMERFTAAQGSGYGMGLGLEDSGGQASPSVNPARDFQAFLSTHLGWGEPADIAKPEEVAEAEFETAEARDHQPGHAGGFGPGLVTITSKSSTVTWQPQARKNSTLEGRKELENDDSAPAAGTKKLKTGAIPQEPINHAPQLIDSGSTTAAATMSDASVTDVESTNPNAQLTTTGASSGVGGSNIQGGSTTSSGTAATGTTGTSRIGPVMAGGARMGTGTSAGSGGTSGGVASVSTNKAAQMSSASLNSGSSGGASGLRKRASSSGSGTSAAASNTRMEAVSSGAFATPLTGSGEATASLRQEDTPAKEQASSGTSEQTTTGASTVNG